MQVLLVIIIFLLCYKLIPRRTKKYPPIVIRTDTDSLIYQYIADAHLLVIETIGIDPLRDPVGFYSKLVENISTVNEKIEALRQQYVATIAKDTEFGKTLQNYDYWRRERILWLEKKKKAKLKIMH